MGVRGRVLVVFVVLYHSKAEDGTSRRRRLSSYATSSSHLSPVLSSWCMSLRRRVLFLFALRCSVGVCNDYTFYSARSAQVLTTRPPNLSLSSCSSAMAPKRIQREDRRAERDEEARRVRARLQTHDGQIEGLGITALQHDLRLQYLESPLKWVTRGFTCTQSFLLPRMRTSELPRPPF